MGHQTSTDKAELVSANSAYCDDRLEANSAFGDLLATGTPLRSTMETCFPNSMHEFLSRMSYADSGSLSNQLSSCGPKPQQILERRLPSDQSPLVPKQSFDLIRLDNWSAMVCDGCELSTPRRFEELKNWLWMKHQQPYVPRPRHCLHLIWLDRSVDRLRSLVRRVRVNKWVKDGRKKQKERLPSGQVQTALSVAGVAAALAVMAAATAEAAVVGDERGSRMGVVVASAAALVAAHCADYAESVGANHGAVMSSVRSGRDIKCAADLMQLTAAASAACSFQGVRHLPNFLKEARIHAAVSPCDAQKSPCLAVSPRLGADDFWADCHYSHEILARGGDFLVRFSMDKLHWRFVSLVLDKYKQVILKLQRRHFAGAIATTQKRIVSALLVSVRPWPGRSLVHNGVERSYFGVVTCHGNIEFECVTQLEHQAWTEGISHLLSVSKQ